MSTTVLDERRREDRARRLAQRRGYLLRKSRVRRWTLNDQNGYMIIEPFTTTIAAGERWDLTLEEVEHWLAERRT